MIEAVKETLGNSKEITALWVTHRLEELKYADGAVYMENGKVVMYGDAFNVRDFVEAKKSSYIKQLNSS